MKKLSLILALVPALVAFAGIAQAQEFDAAFGFGTVTAPAASTNGTNAFPSLSGGLYTTFSGNVLLWHHLGFGGEVAPRWSRSTYGGELNNFGIVQQYRPIFYDFNAVYGRTFQKKFGADVMAGVGGEDLRFYTGVTTCGITCTDYVSSNHFAGHIGADFRYYFWGHAFIRPEAHYYIVHNNAEFNNVNPSRFAISIGYSFMPGF